jgi:hypothetical protein
MRKENTLTATPNHNKRTYTIRRYLNGLVWGKCRTLPMNKQEFEEAEMHTEEDWKWFLTTNDVHVIR